MNSFVPQNQKLGVVEGFYGAFWGWHQRNIVAEHLRKLGYSFYIYAPKGDPFLRRRWKQSWPDEWSKQIADFGKLCEGSGMTFGVGLSPYEIYLEYGPEARRLLINKVTYINTFFPGGIICLLFDDMKGDFSALAELQIEIIQDILPYSAGKRLVMCPTYYTFDPILDELFGERPIGYLESLGKKIDPSVEIFWTGPKICSSEYPSDHLRQVSEMLGRKPFIWDNYPVNDDKRMSPFLHLRAPAGRDIELAGSVSGLAANPMKQAMLSLVPLTALAETFGGKERRSDEVVIHETVSMLTGDRTLADQLAVDFALFQDVGLDGMTPQDRAQLISKYEKFGGPISEEVVGWLQGRYKFDPQSMQE